MLSGLQTKTPKLCATANIFIHLRVSMQLSGYGVDGRDPNEAQVSQDIMIQSSVTLHKLPNRIGDDSMQTMLCKTCTAMFQSSEWGHHHPDLAALSNAAANGCYICEPLLKYALKKYGSLENCLVEPYKYRIYCSEGSTSIHVDMKVLKDGNVTQDCRNFIAVPKSKLPVKNCVKNREIAIPLMEAMGAAQKWLSECLHEHPKCQKFLESPYPTRLLQLQESKTNLILTKEETPLGPYATLSYCWGLNPRFLCLTASNFQELQAGISYSKLPIAFQEAFQVLKSLSIHYIWIDCLCIIQSGPGSIEDWHHECARMQDVYSNCILTLSLAQAKGPQESCLGGYHLETSLPFSIETKGFSQDTPEEKRTCTIVNWDYFRQGLYDQPLGYRAWCLQERLLSPRVLSIGHGEFYWDCVQLPHASESLPEGFKNFPRWRGLDRNQPAIPDTSDREILERSWLTILEEYTDCELTCPETDKLMALSAIASRMSYAMDDVYIAGHFWSMMPLTLNWQIKPPLARDRRREKTPRRLDRHAPSTKGERRIGVPNWSWASIDGPLFQENGINEERDKILMEVESFTLRLTEENNPTGQVEFALLNIKAHIMEIEWTRDGPCMLEVTDLWQDDEHDLEVNIDDPDDKPVEGARCLIAALVTDGWLGHLEGLVLRESKFEGRKVFERIGHFILRSVSQRGDLTVLFKHEKRVLTLN